MEKPLPAASQEEAPHTEALRFMLNAAVSREHFAISAAIRAERKVAELLTEIEGLKQQADAAKASAQKKASN